MGPFNYRHNPFYKVKIFHGFSDNPSTNKIKVVGLLVDHTDEYCGPVTSAEVYDLSTNSWIVIHDSVILASVTDIAYSETFNAPVDGVYRWLIGDTEYYCRTTRSYRDILCFDFRSNQFRKLKSSILVIPDSVSSNVYDDVAEVNDSLAYVVQYYNVRFEIWTWNKDSWTQRYNIGPVDHMDHFYCIWKDGVEVLGGNHRQPLVSVSSDAVCQFQIDIDPFSRIHKYVESIAPLSM